MPDMIVAMNYAGQLSVLVFDKDDSESLMEVNKGPFIS
jgi:hypothetical protein